MAKELLRRAYHEVIGYAPALRRFRAASREFFDYLVTSCAFAPMTFEETGYGAVSRFESPTTVVEVHLDWNEELIFVYVRPAPRSEAARLIAAPGVLLDAIMIHKGKRPEKQNQVIKPDRMLAVLRQYATALRADAPEALVGDFEQLLAIRRARPEAGWRLLNRPPS